MKARSPSRNVALVLLGGMESKSAWERRIAKRRSALKDALDKHAVGVGPLVREEIPDPNNRATSKREWERLLGQFRAKLREQVARKPLEPVGPVRACR